MGRPTSWQNDNGQADIWLMNGTTPTAQSFVGTNPGASWHIKATADFNGDGKSDILWQNDSGEAYIWLMDGTNHVGGGSLGNPGAAWHIEGTGDYNHDGQTDILWQNDNGQADIWLMNGTTPTAQSFVGTNPGSSWHVVDPLVLNLAGGAIQTMSAADSGVTFDMLGDGTVQRTGWITPGEGFLVADPNGAPITSRAQMFSDLLVPEASSGLAALATYDTNGDGKITAADSDFHNIEVWVPGVGGSGGEIYSLAHLGIAAIDLTKTAIDAPNNGNKLLNGFSFQYANGTTGRAAEVGFTAGPDLGGLAATAQLVQAMASFAPTEGSITPASDSASAAELTLQSMIAPNH